VCVCVCACACVKLHREPHVVITTVLATGEGIIVTLLTMDSNH